jgi:hypothetical protein
MDDNIKTDFYNNPDTDNQRYTLVIPRMDMKYFEERQRKMGVKTPDSIRFAIKQFIENNPI